MRSYCTHPELHISLGELLVKVKRKVGNFFQKVISHGTLNGEFGQGYDFHES